MATARDAGIWRWAAAFREAVPTAHRLTLGEASTPLVSLPDLAHAIGIDRLWCKRDDLSAGGSHKARSLAYRVSLARARRENTLLLSSSGNAAVAASLYCAAGGLRLLAFVSPDTSPVKLTVLRRRGTLVICTDRPRNLARYAGRVFGIPNLTPSLDDLSIEGFKTIGYELQEEVPDATDFFTFATSGSSFIGAARAATETRWGARLHAVQAGAAGATAGALDPRFAKSDLPRSALAGLLGIDESPRADDARACMTGTGGRGWVQTDPEIIEAHAWLSDAGIATSAEGAASIAAVARARREGVLDASARAVVLLTGHASQWHGPASGREAVELPSYVALRTHLIEQCGLQPLERE